MCNGKSEIQDIELYFIRVSEVGKVKKDHLVRPEGQVFPEALDSQELRETEDHR